MCAGPRCQDGEEILATFEETTNLPLEIQGALDELTRVAPRARAATSVRWAGCCATRPDHRLEPYEDFAGPRTASACEPAQSRSVGGRDVAWFARRNDPESLRFAQGFEPDFARGVVEVSRSYSRFYGGAIRKFRILSRNRQHPVPVRRRAAARLDHSAAGAHHRHHAVRRPRRSTSTRPRSCASRVTSTAMSTSRRDRPRSTARFPTALRARRAGSTPRASTPRRGSSGSR